MIKRIKRIKDLGLLFADYSSDASTPDFRRCNIIFGWNGSGKTTLSTLFDVIAEPAGTSVSYECELEDGTALHTLDACPYPIRVFNQDYVQKNVNIVEGRANAITVLLGEASQEHRKAIEQDNALLYGSGEPGQFGIVVGLDQKRSEKEKTADARGQLFTDIAKTIGAAIGGEASRRYRKPDAEDDFRNVSKADSLDQAELERQLEVVKRSSMATLEPVHTIGPLERETFGHGGLLDQVDSAIALCGRTLERTVESEVIQRFVENRDIAEWVERGLTLHQKHESPTCEYCGGPLPPDRVAHLAKHFNAADRELKREIDQMINALNRLAAVLSSLKLPAWQAFYKEFEEQAKAAIEKIEAESHSLKEALGRVTVLLGDKKARTMERCAWTEHPSAAALRDAILALNTLIGNHNTATEQLEDLRQSAGASLTKHYLAGIVDEVASCDAKLPLIESEIEDLKKQIRDAKERIVIHQAMVSSAHKGCDELNRLLAVFLAQKELQFVAQTDPKSGEVQGYGLARNGNTANRLSEGEKTAIALVYFVVHLNDGHFDHSKGVVVVDDPISSLDSNSLYQAFSVIKNAIADTNQVFLLTHNFEFLKLLLNWRQRRQNQTAYFQIFNRFDNGCRRALVVTLDKTLQEYDSEYQYLFKLLKNMRTDQDGTVAKAYPVPNIARKFWETFLMFAVPNADNTYTKMDVLKKDGIVSEEKLDAIYKFVNDQSHLTGAGFDPALVPGVQRAIADIFDVVKTVAPKHYEILDAAIA